MGRSSGFIAVHATLASGDVDLCLVPEVPIELEGPRGKDSNFLLKRTVERNPVICNGFIILVLAQKDP